MSWQHNGHVVPNQFLEVEPDFPHAWTFSAQRYVPRPRPVARIILPSHQRASSSVQLETPSRAVVLSRSDSSRSLLKFAHEGGDLTRLSQDVWVHKFWSLYKRLSKFITAVKEKIADGFVAAWSPVRKSFRLLKKVVQAFQRVRQIISASD